MKLISTFRSCLCLALLTALSSVRGAELPNILWIVAEDCSADWMHCYGNSAAKTPAIDALAEQGVRFEHAYSNAPVCAVARSTILTGVYAPSQGTQHMRSRYPIPTNFRSYVSYLREAGYYCTNNAKTDFNRAGDDRSIWDASSGKATYRSRPDGKPFFAIFNLGTSHESSLFSDKLKRSKKSGVIKELSPEDLGKVIVPPYLPDLPEIRSDIANYQQIITAMDAQVGQILKDLEEQGLADSTIVFFYSDHGGILPRGKRYLKDTGVRVPMIVRYPKGMPLPTPFEAGVASPEPVSFIDLAPTLLSLAKIAPPEHMQGRAFLGEHRKVAEPGETEFLFGDRFDELNGMRRGLVDGNFKYIRRFRPRLPAAPYSFYQFGQAGWKAWRAAWQNGELTGRHAAMWEPNQPVEELFDLKSDPWEVKNLAKDPAFSKQLESYRERLKQQMLAVKDTGIIAESFFPGLLEDHQTIAGFAQQWSEYKNCLNLAFQASKSEPTSAKETLEWMKSTDSMIRYWAAQLVLNQETPEQKLISQLEQMTKDSELAVVCSAAEALIQHGRQELAKNALLKGLGRPISEPESVAILNLLIRQKWTKDIPEEWFKSQKGKDSKYLDRLEAQIKKME